MVEDTVNSTIPTPFTLRAMKLRNIEPGFLLLAVFFTIQVFATTTNGDEGLIIKSCNHTSVPDYCVALLKSDKRSFNEDLRGLLNISIHLSPANATNTCKFINETLLPNATDPPMLRQCLEGCSFVYNEGMETLSDALDLLAKGDYLTMDVTLGAALGIKSSCEDAFVQFNVPVPTTLSLRDDVMFNLSRVSMGLGDLFLH